ncbi:hypothetical protein DOY81_012606 [Sarcophaga bullata]|nr:hypothetical protein DOY81_012606 [Sarcophaga bullata]
MFVPTIMGQGTVEQQVEWLGIQMVAGGLGHTANYAVVVAQLHTQGESVALAPFIVQVRDEETHMPMLALILGNWHKTNHMLMKNQQVLPDGTYVPPKNSVLTLCEASTIACRYSAVRRQSPIDPNQPEPQIMDHTTQQLKFSPKLPKLLYSRLTVIHIQYVQSNICADTAAGVEVCRLSCGGHGFMDSSNFPTLYGMSTAVCTYEGENTVMLLQTARYLVKVYGQALAGIKLVPTVAYIEDAIKYKEFNNFDGSLESIVKAFQFVAASKIRIAYERLENRRKQGYGPEVAANLCGIELTQAADLHGRAFLASSALYELQKLSSQVSPALGDVLKTILELYLVDACLNRIGDFLRFINFTDKDISQLELRLQSCLQRLRPNAVALVDAFDIDDRILDSALGAWDGNVYERMFEAAKKSPLNKEPVNISFHKYLKPFMKANL